MKLTSETPILSLGRGETLFHSGQIASTDIVQVTSGCLKLRQTYRSGLYLAGLLGPGDVLGFSEAMAGAGGRPATYRWTVAAAQPATLRSLPIDQALREWGAAVGVDPSCALFRPVQSHFKRPLELLPVRSRVAATIWTLGRRLGQRVPETSRLRIDADLTREEIAHLAGTVYESVIRTLTQLKKERVLDLDGRVIDILDEDALARIGHLVVAKEHDQNTVPHDHRSTNNRSSQEAS